MTYCSETQKLCLGRPQEGTKNINVCVLFLKKGTCLIALLSYIFDKYQEKIENFENKLKLYPYK